MAKKKRSLRSASRTGRRPSLGKKKTARCGVCRGEFGAPKWEKFDTQAKVYVGERHCTGCGAAYLYQEKQSQVPETA